MTLNPGDKVSVLYDLGWFNGIVIEHGVIQGTNIKYKVAFIDGEVTRVNLPPSSLVAHAPQATPGSNAWIKGWTGPTQPIVPKQHSKATTAASPAPVPPHPPTVAPKPVARAATAIVSPPTHAVHTPAPASALPKPTSLPSIKKRTASDLPIDLEDFASKPKKAKKVKEKRLGRCRSKATKDITDRINRVMTQRMFLVDRKPMNPKEPLSREFVVLGSIGNVYNVKISQFPSCTCPDNAKGNLCKHILFVMLKVLKVDQHSPLAFQNAYLSSELKEIFLAAPQATKRGVMANSKVLKEYKRLNGGGADDDDDDEPQEEVGKRRPVDGDCPICYEEMHAKEKLEWCRTCGNNLHSECLNEWKKANRHQVTCVLCRSPWKTADTPKATAATMREGYLNMGGLQGQDDERDLSSYEWKSQSYWY